MIEFPEDRVERVRKLIESYDPGEDDSYAPIHKVLSQSFKAVRLKHDGIRMMAAISYLFTGEPEDLEVTDVEVGRRLAVRLFGGEKRLGADQDLLLRHALRLLAVEPAEKGRNEGYIDYEDEHLTLIGGFTLLLCIVRALVAPYEPRDARNPGMLTSKQIVLTDLAMWLRRDVIRAALDAGYRHWPFWDEYLLRGSRRGGGAG